LRNNGWAKWLPPWQWTANKNAVHTCIYDLNWYIFFSISSLCTDVNVQFTLVTHYKSWSLDLPSVLDHLWVSWKLHTALEIYLNYLLTIFHSVISFLVIPCRYIQTWWTVIQPIISLEMPVPSQGHYGFHSFPVVDWFCLFIHLLVLTFPLQDCSELGNFAITLIYHLYNLKCTCTTHIKSHFEVKAKWFQHTYSSVYHIFIKKIIFQSMLNTFTILQYFCIPAPVILQSTIIYRITKLKWTWWQTCNYAQQYCARSNLHFFSVYFI
jgi:hypothetical protein